MRLEGDVEVSNRWGASARIVVLCCLVPMLGQLAWAMGARAGAPTITDFIKRPGDQVVVVPNGTYAGGSVTAPHAQTDGPYKGWLVLVAESPRGVVIDMSQSPLVLELGTSRVLFVGFKFINGTLSVRGDDISFWYTEHTFPIEEWNRQYQAAGGNADAFKKMSNPLPKAIWIGDQTQGHILHGTQILGSDVHDAGDDGVFIDKSVGSTIAGARIWNIDEKNYDPGYNPWISSMHDLFHNDAVQIPGAVDNFTMTDSYVGQVITVGGDNANATNLTWKNLWIARSDGAGMVFYVQNNFRISGAMQNIRAWSNGFKQNPYDPGWDQLRIDIVDDKQTTWPDSKNDPRLSIASLGTNLNEQPPPGVTMSGGRMNNQAEALDNPLNPSNAWRAAQPYNSWPSLFGLPVKSDAPALAAAPATTATPAPPKTAVKGAGVAFAPQAATTSAPPQKKTVAAPHAPATSHPASSAAQAVTVTSSTFAPPTSTAPTPVLALPSDQVVALPAPLRGPGNTSDALPRLAVILALMGVSIVGSMTITIGRIAATEGVLPPRLGLPAPRSLPMLTARLTARHRH